MLSGSIKGRAEQSREKGGGRNPEKQSNQPRKAEHTKHNPKKYRVKNEKNQPRKTELRTKKKSRENRAQIQIQGERENKRAAHNEENYP
jgi:hypothetical protein